MRLTSRSCSGNWSGKKDEDANYNAWVHCVCLRVVHLLLCASFASAKNCLVDASQNAHFSDDLHTCLFFFRFCLCTTFHSFTFHLIRTYAFFFQCNGRIRRIDGVSEVHDLHVWSLSNGAPLLTAHAHARDPVQALTDAQKVCKKHGIAQATFQITPDGTPCQSVGLCGK